MKTMPSVQAQKQFEALINSAQKEIVSITEQGQTVVYVMSPQVAQDWMDAQLAVQAEQEGLLSSKESDDFLMSIRNAHD